MTGTHGNYGQFSAMIATFIVVIFGLISLNINQWGQTRWREIHDYTTFIMGAAMAVIMFGFKLGLYKRSIQPMTILTLEGAEFKGKLSGGDL